MTLVDHAKIQDLPVVAKLAYAGLKEAGESPAIDYLSDAIEVNFWLTPILTLRHEGEIVGVVPLRVSGCLWSKEKYLTSIIYYILPEYRNSANIKKLTDKVREIATLHGLPYKDTFLCTDKFDARKRLLRSNGFRQIGIYMELNSG